jgi:hypothetical protein
MYANQFSAPAFGYYDREYGTGRGCIRKFPRESPAAVNPGPRNSWPNQFFCHPDRSEGSQVIEKAGFFGAFRMAFFIELKFGNSFKERPE